MYFPLHWMNLFESSQALRGRDRNKRVLTLQDDQASIESSQEVATDYRFKQDNTWENGYLVRVEELINQKLPMSGIRADPHIDSRWKTLKAKYNAIAEMLNKSGFGWDDMSKMIQCERSVYDEWCKNHKEARSLWKIIFLFFMKLES
ncbi:uncharacterized protein [Euphorbia lathyris]|uniref:uncharacterized protein n=1 Tax=Euphorbia lathyris TaxID=212925 RepID=UPI003313EA70